jgi:polyphenol oxidase
MVLSSLAFLVVALSVVVSRSEAAPFPPADLNMCGWAYNTTEPCCSLPDSRSGSPIKKFDPQAAHLPLRFRRAAHLLDDAYIEKYQRAVEIMRSLPETDGRSFQAQYRLHCAYCNNHLYFAGHEYPLEIHQSWFFLPWHRLFIFFHERILAKLIGDDDFALPFWNWDSQNNTAPFPNQIPWAYASYTSYSPNAANKTNSLWDPDRNVCSAPPRLVEFQDFIRCDPRPFPDLTRTQSAHLLWTQMVSVGVTPQIMAGGIYRFGDYGARGMGAIEARPHGPMHAWTNVRDMGTFKIAASDPIFYGLHGNIDRLWELWKTLPGNYRGELTDPDYLDSQLTFYDEDGEQVSATIKDFLNLSNIRSKQAKLSPLHSLHHQCLVSEICDLWICASFLIFGM